METAMMLKDAKTFFNCLNVRISNTIASKICAFQVTQVISSTVVALCVLQTLAVGKNAHYTFYMANHHL